MGLRFEGKENSRGELDIVPIAPALFIDASRSAKASVKKDENAPTDLNAPWTASALVWIITLFGTVLVALISTAVGITLMTITSTTFASVLGIIMLEMDENDGLRAISICPSMH